MYISFVVHLELTQHSKSTRLQQRNIKNETKSMKTQQNNAN